MFITLHALTDTLERAWDFQVSNLKIDLKKKSTSAPSEWDNRELLDLSCVVCEVRSFLDRH